MSENHAVPILYSFRRCPYAMRARMALWSSGLTVEFREIVLGRKPSALLLASPKGTVPVLDFGDHVIEQSLEIMLWALGRSDPERWLAADRNQMLLLIETNDSQFKKHLDRYKYPERYSHEVGNTDGEEAAPLGADARDAGLNFLQSLETILSKSSGDFLFGSSPVLADIVIFPFIRQFANVDSAWFQDLPLTRLKSWLSLCLKLDVFLAVMERMEEWKAGHEAIYWGRSYTQHSTEKERTK